jgi:hypothetical protein
MVGINRDVRAVLRVAKEVRWRGWSCGRNYQGRRKQGSSDVDHRQRPLEPHIIRPTALLEMDWGTEMGTTEWVLRRIRWTGRQPTTIPTIMEVEMQLECAETLLFE